MQCIRGFSVAFYNINSLYNIKREMHTAATAAVAS